MDENEIFDEERLRIQHQWMRMRFSRDICFYLGKEGYSGKIYCNLKLKNVTIVK
jgi:hypothetical protein